MDNQIKNSEGTNAQQMPTGYLIQSSDGSAFRVSGIPPWIRTSLNNIQNDAYEQNQQFEAFMPPEKIMKIDTSLSHVDQATHSQARFIYSSERAVVNGANHLHSTDISAKKSIPPQMFTANAIPVNKIFTLMTEDEIKHSQWERLHSWQEKQFPELLTRYINKKNYKCIGDINTLRSTKTLCDEDMKRIESSLNEACRVVEGASQQLAVEDEKHILRYISLALNIKRHEVLVSAYRFLTVTVNRMKNYLNSCRDYNFNRILFFDRTPIHCSHRCDLSTVKIFNLSGDQLQRIFIKVDGLRDKYKNMVPIARTAGIDKKLVVMVLREAAKITNGAKGFFYLPCGDFTGEVMNAKDARYYFFDSLALWIKNNDSDVSKQKADMKNHLYRASDKNILVDDDILLKDISENETARADILLSNAATFVLYLSEIASGRAFNANVV